MNVFKKLCYKCKEIEPIRKINSVENFFDVLQKMKQLINDGSYEYIGGNNPEETIKKWPQDGLWYRIKCKNCGAIFTLYYDIFIGKGSFKKGK